MTEETPATQPMRTAQAPRPPRGKYGPVLLNEDEILRRGLATFAELGYAATTMRELARRLDVSHNFINDRYGSKGNFWVAVVDFALRDVQSGLDRLLAASRDDGERLRNVVVRLYRLAANASELNRLITDESTRDSSRLDHLHQRFVKPFWDSIEPTVDNLMAAGRIPRVPTHILYFAITGPALTLAQDPIADRLNPAASPVANQDRDAMADALSGLVLRGLLPPPHGETTAASDADADARNRTRTATS
ncbi:TetR/AcrR family transcriptional regulator [Streptomyces sp. NPDC058691]|uniref:TetR/AcrR family transcriptional regulator n=1 Tax=Streptomyces sp. NPDC058691 TaxID=3346601 RepID=UPI00364F825F